MNSGWSGKGEEEGATWFRSQTVALTVIVDYACCVSFSLSFVQLTIAIACAGYNAVASARRQADRRHGRKGGNRAGGGGFRTRAGHV